MHKKILLLLDRNQFESFDYTQDFSSAMITLGGNSGNNVFQYALQKLLTNPDNEVTIDTSFLHENIQFDDNRAHFINDNYDCLVFSPANVIAIYAKKTKLNFWTQRLNKINIPIYAIGLGTQSDNKFSMEFLDEIKEEAISFIRAIIKNGGYIGTRGYFTSDCLKKLGFIEGTHFETIGCPSLFMLGDKLKIQKKEIEEKNFKPVLNGFRAFNSDYFQRYFLKYPNSQFIDQEEFYRLLYIQNKLTEKDMQYVNKYGSMFLKLHNENRVKLYCDFMSWYNEIKSSNFHFSFGCRIHGNVVSILAGIPAFIDAFDSRVKELAQYFEIPYREFDDAIRLEDPYKLYLESDYTMFNEKFKSKYEKFEKFCNKCNLKIDPITEIPKDYETPPFNPISKSNKKVVFVAHEFGLYNGHGGIASYLYNITSWLLENTNFEISVLADCYDTNCDLYKYNNRFKLFKLSGDLNNQRIQVYNIINNIVPDYVEIADFNALGLKCIEARIKDSSFLKETVFIVNSHTATKECWEWSSGKEIFEAPEWMMMRTMQETQQLQKADYCISPSSFLAKYVTKAYHLKEEAKVFANPYFKYLETKDEIKTELSKIKNIDFYNDSFNIVLITRFEGRKHQDRLINAFLRLKNEGKNIRLFLAGNTTTFGEDNEDYRAHLYHLLNEEDKKNLYIFDFLNIEQQKDLIAIADLAIMPSTYENQPVAMVETVLRKVPVMGSIYSGIKDYTSDERLLFDPFDENSLTDKIRTFLELSTQDKKQIQEVQFNNLNGFLAPHRSILPRFYLTRRFDINEK